MIRREWLGISFMMQGGWRLSKTRIDPSALSCWHSNWYLRWFVEQELLIEVPDAREYAVSAMGTILYRR